MSAVNFNRNRSIKAAVLLAASVGLGLQSAQAGSSTWLGTGDAFWETGTNWADGVVPGSSAGAGGASTDVAYFENVVAQNTVSVDLNRNIGTLQFGSISLPAGTTTAYTIGNAGIDAGNALYFSNGGAIRVLASVAPTHAVNEGHQVVINAPMVLNGTSFSFISEPGSTTETRPGLALYGKITAGAGAPTTITFSAVGGSRSSSRNEAQSQITDGPGGAVVTLVKDGPGCWEMNQSDLSPNTYSGDTILNGGVLRTSSAGTFNGLGGFSPNSRYIVNSGAELRNGAAGSTLKSVVINPGGSMTVGTAASTTLNFAANSGPSLHFNFGAGQASFTVSGPFYLKGTNPNEGGIKLSAGASTGTVTIGASTSVFDLGTVTRVFDIGKGDALNPYDLRMTSAVVGGGANGGITKIGAGILRFDNAGSNWTGTLEIREGEVRGSIDNAFPGQPILKIAGGNLHVLGTAGTNTQTFGPVTITKGNITAGSTLASTVRAPSFTINTAAGDTASIAAILADSAPAASLVKNGAGVATLTGANSYTGGTIINGGTLSVNTNAEDIILVGQGADVRRGRLVFDYTGGTSPANSIVSTILAPGYASNFSTGQIKSTTAVSGVQGLGWNDNGTGNFVVGYVRYGDANLSGGVDLDDFTALAANFGLAGGWGKGDFNYDGAVNLDDFTALASNFGQTVPLARSSVPEPAGFGLLSFVGAMLLRRKAR